MQKEKEQNGTPTCWSGKAEQAQLPESATANQPTKQTKKTHPFPLLFTIKENNNTTYTPPPPPGRYQNLVVFP